MCPTTSLTNTPLTIQKLNKSLCAAVPEMTSEELWKCVVNISSFHVGWSVEQGMFSSKVAKKYMGDERSARTAVGVERLAYPGCFVEIALMAAVPGLS